MLTAHAPRGPSRSRGWWIAIAAVAAVVVGGVVAYRYVLPGVVERRVERMLQSHGFPGAHVERASLGLDRVRLGDVTLGAGLELGAVELDAGLELLWRPRFHQLTLQGARLSARMLDRLVRSSVDLPAGGLPFDVVRIASGVVMIDDVPVAVSGTIAPAAHAVSVDLEARTDLVKLGVASLHEVHATIHDVSEGLRACVTGRTFGATVEACSTLPRMLADLGKLRAVDLTWRADAPGWRLSGRGTFTWASTLELTAGHIDVVTPSLIFGAATLHNASFTAEVAGNLSRLELDVHGIAQAERLELRDRAVFASASTVRVPLLARVAIVDGAVRVTPRKPIVAAAQRASIRSADTVAELVQPSLAAYDAGQTIVLDSTFAAPHTLRWSASAARVGATRLQAPSGALIAKRTLRWRATEAQWRGARFREPAGELELDAQRRHTATWVAVSGPGSLELGAGEIRFHRAQDQWVFDYGRSAALGGELVLEPAAAPPHQPIDLLIHAHNLELHRVLASFARGHADGSGILDGEFALQIDEAGPRLTRGALHARAAGGLQLSDAAWRAQASASATSFALHQRIAATLSDFEYSHLAAVLHPVGTDPELQVTTQGRGRRVAQDLDLVINLRGVRDVAERLAIVQSLRSKP